MDEKLTSLDFYYLLTEVLEVGVDEVHEGVLEVLNNMWPYKNSFLFKIAHAEWIKANICLEIAEVLEGVVEDSDQHGTI